MHGGTRDPRSKTRSQDLVHDTEATLGGSRCDGHHTLSSFDEPLARADRPTDNNNEWKQQEEKNDARSVHWNPGLSPGFFFVSNFHETQIAS
jgi:hypothetical protein